MGGGAGVIYVRLWQIAKLIVFILLCVHLGWSWWLLALIFVCIEWTAS